MRLLLDTHALIWALVSPEELSKAAGAAIAHLDNEIFVSTASIWEIAIKFALRRRSAPPLSASDAINGCQIAGYRILDIEPAHAAATETLTFDHGDPFDRLLVAQALGEPFILVTRDPAIRDFMPRSVLW